MTTTRFPRESHAINGSALTTILTAVTCIAVLYLAREVLVPIALALLLSFALTPVVTFLQAWYFPRLVAVMFVVLCAFSAIFGLGTVIVSQIQQLAGDLPSYQSTLREKIQSLRGAAGGSRTLERAAEVLQDLSKEIDRPNSSTSVPPLSEQTRTSRPVPVEIKQPEPGALQTLTGLITPLIHPLTTTGIVIIFVIFILLQRQDLRNRLVRLAGAQDLQRTTAALDDAGQRLSRLFLTQLALNAGLGLVVGLGLWIIGVPSAPLWGVFAMIMRFVPYVGALISAVFPLILAAAAGPGWTMVFLTAALFLTAETVVGQAIEPLVYGHSTGLSPVAVVAAATFWTWLWGPIGLILATPLTMCLVVIGRHVDRLKFLEVMLGDQPPLTPAEIVYQRMLARDPVEAAEQAQTFLKEKPLAVYYDELLLEGLKLAQADAERGLLDDERTQRIRDAVVEIVDDLSEHTDRVEGEKEPAAESDRDAPLAQLDKLESPGAEQASPKRWPVGKPVLCLPGLGLLDEAVAILIAQLVERRGIGTRVEEPDALSISKIFSLETKDVALICLCYIETATAAQIRYAIRRVHRKAPGVRILVALFGSNTRIDEQMKAHHTEFAEGTLQAAVDKIMEAAIEADDRTSPSQPVLVLADEDKESAR